MSLKAYVEGLFGPVSVQLGGGKTFRRWSLAEGHWGVLVTGILGTEPFSLSAFLLLWSPVLPSAVCFNRDILFTNAPGHLGQPMWKVLELSRASPLKLLWAFCSRARKLTPFVHTDLISSFSHCYRRHFMTSVFLNLLRFMIYHDLFWKMTWLHLTKLFIPLLLGVVSQFQFICPPFSYWSV